MAQSMHMSSVRHDENAFNHAGLQAKENSSSQQASKSLGSAAKPLQSARKAFGNITNTKGDNVAQQPQTASKRRAFGDLTNSTAKPSALKPLLSKPPATSSKLSSGASGSQAAPHVTQAAEAASSAEAAALAAGGMERSAGKTWAQLEAEREQQEDMAINQSVSNIVRGLVGNSGPLGRLQVLQDGGMQEDEEEVLQPEEESNGLSSLVSQGSEQHRGRMAPSTSTDNGGDCSSLWEDHTGTDDILSLLPDVLLSPMASKACTPDDGTKHSSRTAEELQHGPMAASPLGEPW